MKKEHEKQSCVLGIAPSSRGIGFVVMTGNRELIDSGVKTVKSGKKNERCLAHAINLIEMFKPDVIAIEDCSKSSRRKTRIQDLAAQIIEVAEKEDIKVRRFSRKQLNKIILSDEAGTKQALAEHLAQAFRDQLGFRLPKKRQLWTSEAYQMDIFDAVALAQCCFGGDRFPVPQ